MARTETRAAHTPPTSYELMGLRLQKVINSSASQLSRSAVLERRPEDQEQDWDRLIEEIGENEHVTIRHRGNHFLTLAWSMPTEH